MIDYSSYKLEEGDGVLVLEVTGRLDSSTAGFLLDCIEGYIERGERRIVLDCSELDAISSEGLAVFVTANSKLKGIGGKIALAGVKGTVAEVLKMVHFDRLFNLHPNVEEAAKTLQE